MATNGDGANVGRGVPELKRAIIEAGKKVNSAVHLTSFGLHDRACLYWPILSNITVSSLHVFRSATNIFGLALGVSKLILQSIDSFADFSRSTLSAYVCIALDAAFR